MKADPTRLTLDNYPRQIQMPTNFGDVDIGGHLNNTAIAGYYENSRALFNVAMFGAEIFRANAPFRIVVATTTIDYFREGFFPDPVTVGIGVVRIGNTSYQLSAGLFQNGECLGICDTTLVLLDDNGPMRVPDSAREFMRGYHFPSP